jgi:ketosteroid isomerase-like protein
VTKIFFILTLSYAGLVSFGQSIHPDSRNMDKQTVYDFVKAINAHDIDKICLLMADDHKFVDAHGNEVIGKDKMKAGWTSYLQWFPDYKVEITDIFANSDTLAAFGFASGTFLNKKTDNNENYWRLPASWKIVLAGNKIKLWQVYADTKIPFDIIDKNK